MEDEGFQLEDGECWAKHYDKVAPPPGFKTQLMTQEIVQPQTILNAKTLQIPTKSIPTNKGPSAKSKHFLQTSSETSASIVQIAKESLKIGEILGLKVTDNEQAVVSRITKNLKKNEKYLPSKPREQASKGSFKL